MLNGNAALQDFCIFSLCFTLIPAPYLSPSVLAHHFGGCAVKPFKNKSHFRKSDFLSLSLSVTLFFPPLCILKLYGMLYVRAWPTSTVVLAERVRGSTIQCQNGNEKWEQTPHLGKHPKLFFCMFYIMDPELMPSWSALSLVRCRKVSIPLGASSIPGHVMQRDSRIC